MRPTRRTTSLLTAVGLAIGAFAGVASAQAQAPKAESVDNQVIIEEFTPKIDLAETVPGALANGQSRFAQTFSIANPGEKVVIRIVNGQVSGTRNGEPLDPELIQKNGDRIIVLDGQGQRVVEIPTGGVAVLPEGGANVWRLSGRVPGIAQAPNPPQFAVTAPNGQNIRNNVAWATQSPAVAPPSVMVGITMGEPGDSLLQHFGMDDGDAIMVTGTVEGLPADKAGLKRGDLIVAIAGKRPASPELLREVLEKLDPGDGLAMTVIQRGEKKNIGLKVVAYDAEKLSRAVTVPGIEIRRGARDIERDAARLRIDADRARQQADRQLALIERRAQAERRAGEAHRRMLEAMPRAYREHLHDHEHDHHDEHEHEEENQFWFYVDPETGEDAIRLRIQPEFEEALRLFDQRGLEGLSPMLRGHDWEQFADMFEGQADHLSELLEDRGEAMTDELEERLEALEEQLEERIEARLERLESMIERLMDRLEAEFENRFERD